ncbi:MAG: hypothetical protein AAF620_19710 [Bacteroidota bacterium]
MKTFNSKNLSKTSRKWAWMTMLLIGVTSVGITSCSEDDNSEITTVDEVEAESAFLQVYQNSTPGGRITYIRVTETIPEIADITQSIELGTEITIKTFGGQIFAVNPDASTITKWVVDKSSLELSVASVLSFASSGISSTRSLTFASETQAFLFDVVEGVLLELNPESMEITKTHDIGSALPGGSDGMRIGVNEGFLLNSGKVVWSVSYVADNGCCINPIPENVPSVGVFDPTTDQFTYKYDDRLYGGGSASVNDNGTVYISPNAYIAMNYHYFNILGEPRYYTLRLDDNGDFDTSFEFELTEVIDIDYGGYLVAKNGDEILVDYYDIDEWAEAWDDRWNWWGNSLYDKASVINLETKEVAPFTGFDNYSNGGNFINNIDGVNYFGGYNWIDNVGWESDLLKQESFESFTVVTKGSAGVSIGDFVKLW